MGRRLFGSSSRPGASSSPAPPRLAPLCDRSWPRCWRSTGRSSRCGRTWADRIDAHAGPGQLAATARSDPRRRAWRRVGAGVRHATRPAVEATVTITPSLRSRMPGTTARMHRNAPVALTAKCRCRSQAWLRPARTTRRSGIVDQHVDRADLFKLLATAASSSHRIRTSDPERRQRRPVPAQRDDSLAGGREPRDGGRPIPLPTGDTTVRACPRRHRRLPAAGTDPARRSFARRQHRDPHQLHLGRRRTARHAEQAHRRIAPAKWCATPAPVPSGTACTRTPTSRTPGARRGRRAAAGGSQRGHQVPAATSN